MTLQGNILMFDEAMRVVDRPRPSVSTPKSASKKPTRRRPSGGVTPFESIARKSASTKKVDRPSVKASTAKPKQAADKKPSVKQAADRRTSTKQAVDKKPAVKQEASKRPPVASKKSEGVRKQDSEGQGHEKKAKISKFAELKRVHSKSKADKAFTRQFGGTASSAANSGSRAALYKGEMGRQHKRMTQMQQSALTKNASPKRLREGSRWRNSPKFVASMVIVVCLALSCLFLYPVTKQFYLAMRHHDRLEAEYAAVQERNQAIQDQVDALSSPEGIEDRARKEFGWIKEGEQGGTVYGLDREGEEKAYMKNIPAGSVDPPQRWYTPFLDMLFGVE